MSGQWFVVKRVALFVLTVAMVLTIVSLFASAVHAQSARQFKDASGRINNCTTEMQLVPNPAYAGDGLFAGWRAIASGDRATASQTHVTRPVETCIVETDTAYERRMAYEAQQRKDAEFRANNKPKDMSAEDVRKFLAAHPEMPRPIEPGSSIMTWRGYDGRQYVGTDEAYYEYSMQHYADCYQGVGRNCDK